MFVAAGDFAFVVTKRSAQCSISGFAISVITHKRDVVIFCRFKEQIVLKAIIDNDGMDSSSFKVLDCVVYGR